jgi:hypothetical protein
MIALCPSCARYVPIPPPRLPGLDDALLRVYGLLVASCGQSNRATVDLEEVARELGMRPLTVRIAIAGLRLSGEIEAEHAPERFERMTISLPGALP